MNALGYVRISTKDQSTYSLDYQDRNVRNYCSANNLNLLAIFKDDGESSYSFDRPDWLELEKYIKKNKNVQYLIIFDHDRFSRNLAEALLKIKELQDKYNIKVLATTDAFNTDFSDPSTFIMRAFKLMMAESELWRIRQRTKAGIVQATLNGRHANLAPYGYINQRDKEGKPIIVIVPEKATIVRKIYDLHLSGTAINEIRKIAFSLGYTQKNKGAIQRVLTNPVYAGMLHAPKGAKIAEQYIKGIHEPIVSEEIFYLTQDKLSGKHITVQSKEEVFLRGILHCPNCGKLMTAGNSKSHTARYYWYYVCCKKNLSAKKLHQQFDELLENMSMSNGNELFTLIKKEVLKRRGEKDVLIKEYTSKLNKASNKIQQTEEKYLMSEGISKATYDKVMTSLRAEKADYVQKLTALETSDSEIYDRLEIVVERLSNLKKYFYKLDLQQQQALLKEIFQNSLYYEDNFYRTRHLHPLFAHNRLILKEKGLLETEQSLINLTKSSMCSEDGN